MQQQLMFSNLHGKNLFAQGFYEILSLTGSYNLAHGGGLSVTLCSPERNVIGGVLGGPLVAAGTVQVPFHYNIWFQCSAQFCSCSCSFKFFQPKAESVNSQMFLLCVRS
jgi:hypothetical protein